MYSVCWSPGVYVKVQFLTVKIHLLQWVKNVFCYKFFVLLFLIIEDLLFSDKTVVLFSFLELHTIVTKLASAEASSAINHAD